jgi:hypothetical protein
VPRRSGFAGALGDLDEVLELLDAIAPRTDWVTLVTDCEMEARRLIDADWPSIEKVAQVLADSAEGMLDDQKVRSRVTPTPGVT